MWFTKSKTSRMWLRFVVVVCTALPLSACFVTSEHPVASPTTAYTNLTLIGAWYGKMSDEEPLMYAHFLPGQSDASTPYAGGMDLILVMHDEEEPDDGEWVLFYAVAGEAGGRKFLSLQGVEGEVSSESAAENQDFHLFTYQIIEDGTLEITRLSNEFLETAITENRLQGTVSTEQYGGAVISAPPADLIAFLETTGFPPEMFEEEATRLKRLPSLSKLP